MPRLTQRSRDARRAQILAAARRCFTPNGFQATSMQDIFTESGLSAGAVYSHFTGKDEIVTAIADEVIDTITATFDAAIADSQALRLEDILENFFTTLQHADVAAIAITVWAEALRDRALRRRLATRYHRMGERLTELVLTQQGRGAIDPAAPARHVAQVLTALGPAFLHQRAFDTTVTAATFTQGMGALLAQR
jgi:AcrR family transcriptional regulator